MRNTVKAEKLRKKVTNGLQWCFKEYGDEGFFQCEKCPYYNPDVLSLECKQELLNDALSLLKKPEAIDARPDRDGIVSHLQIIHTWASFAAERNLLLNGREIEKIADWSMEAVDFLT